MACVLLIVSNVVKIRPPEMGLHLTKHFLSIMVNLLLSHIWRSAVVFYFLAKLEINLVNDKFLKVETSTGRVQAAEQSAPLL